MLILNLVFMFMAAGFAMDGCRDQVFLALSFSHTWHMAHVTVMEWEYNIRRTKNMRCHWYLMYFAFIIIIYN